MAVKKYNGDIKRPDRITPELKGTFLANKYETILLPKGFVLWRFLSKRNQAKFGLYWIDSTTMRDIIMVSQNNKSFRPWAKKENIRNQLNILSEWSNLGWRCKIKLQREVVAYRGIVNTQKEFIQKDGPFEAIEILAESRRGRATQYVIPRFGSKNYQSGYFSVTHFSDV